MSRDFFSVYRGIELDEAMVILQGTGDPGFVGDTTSAPKGSIYTDISTGNQWAKTSAGSGPDKWSQMATRLYVQSLASLGVVWRDPVSVIDITSTTTAAILADINVDDLIQGIAVTAGMRILGANVTASKNVFIVGGSSGAWSLTQDINSQSPGDTLYVISGIGAGSTYNYNGTNWVLIDQSTVNEDGFIRTFIGKSASGNVTPTYTSNNFIADADSLETALGKIDTEIGTNVIDGSFVLAANKINANIQALDTEIGTNVINGSVILAANKINANIQALDTEETYINTFIGKTVGANTPTYSSQTYVTNGDSIQTAVGELDSALTFTNKKTIANGVTAITTIDSVVGNMVEWDVYVVSAADSTRVRVWKVFAAQNGVTFDYTRFAALAVGGTITGLAVTVDLIGGALCLRVESTASCNVTARRLTAI